MFPLLGLGLGLDSHRALLQRGAQISLLALCSLGAAARADESPATPEAPAAAAPAAAATAAPAPADSDALAPHLPTVQKVRVKVCTVKPGQKPGPKAELCQALREFEGGKTPLWPAKDSLSVGPLWRVVEEDVKPWGALPLRMMPSKDGASPKVVWSRFTPDNVQETFDTNKYLQSWRIGKPDDKSLVARLIRAEVGNELQRVTETPDALKAKPSKTSIAIEKAGVKQVTQMFLRQKGPKLYALIVAQETLNPSTEPRQVLYFASLPPLVAVPAAPAPKPAQ